MTAPKDVAFIHQEIYNDNQVNKGLRRPLIAWRLRTEPWRSSSTGAAGLAGSF